MHFKSFFFCVVVSLSSSLAFALEDKVTLVFPGFTKSFTLSELKKKLPVTSVTQQDPIYNKKKTFDGFLLFDVLKLAGPIPTGVDEFVFSAADGYSPTASISKVRELTPVLAFQEHGNPKKWDKVLQGKTWLSPAPFYLVWKNEKAASDAELPRPYQLVRIELMVFSVKYANLYPHDAKPDSDIMKGFVHFKDSCMRCHSMNLQGGELGPELNIPKNITEYWHKSTIREFVKNSNTFRLRSKMPPFPQLTDSDLDHVLDYFEYMKNHKISP